MPNRQTRKRNKAKRNKAKRISLNASAPSFNVLHANARSFHPLHANAPIFHPQHANSHVNEPILHFNDTLFQEDDENEFDNLSRAIVEERRRHTKSRGGKKNKRKTRKLRKMRR